MSWIYFLALPVALYVLVSLRVLKQYERGVVFCSANSPASASPG